MKVFPTVYSRGTITDRNHITAVFLDLHQGWVLRSIFGPAYFYNNTTNQWVYFATVPEAMWRNKCSDEERESFRRDYILSFDDMMKAMETVPSFKEIEGKK